MSQHPAAKKRVCPYFPTHAPRRPSRRDTRLPRLRRRAAAWAAAGGPRLARDPPSGLRPGARPAGARERAAVRRPVWRPAARLDGRRPRHLLRPPGHRRGGAGVLLSGDRPSWRRLSAAGPLRGALAGAAAGRTAQSGADPAAGPAGAAMGARRPRRRLDERDSAGLACLPARHPGHAAPVLAQHRLAEAPTLVRGRSCALFARADPANPFRMKPLAILAAVLALAACAPIVQRPLTPPPTFAGPRIEGDRFISFDGAALGLSHWDVPAGQEPWAVIVGLHGMDDYANAF